MRNLFTLILMSLISAVSLAKPVYQSHSGIVGVVENYVENTLIKGQSDIEVLVGKLDPRLRLTACEGNMQAFMPEGSRRNGNTTVGVRCSHDKPWSLFVPVRVKVMRNIVILRNHLPRGVTLTLADVDMRRIDISSETADYFQSTSDVVGHILTRSVRAGRQLNRHDIAAADVIKRGELVTLLAETQGFAVRMQGKALTDGSRGELIRVKNVNSSRIIEGIVKAPGIIQVKM
jgi:flagellar basal body P-ring formation protein FlgA